MNNPYVKLLLPHAIAALTLLLVAFIYMGPALSGKVLSQSDNVQALGAQKEMSEVYKKTGEMPQWTNRMFSGMPTAQIMGMQNSKNFVEYVGKPMRLFQDISHPESLMFLAFIGVYILLITLGVDWKLSVFGALMYGLATLQVDLALAGHSTKLLTMGFVAPTIAGVLLAYRGKYLLGGGLTAIFMSLQLISNHIQITYYVIFLLAFLGIAQLIKTIQDKNWSHFVKASGVLVIAGLLALASNTAQMWSSYTYAEETIRGKSELTVPASTNTTTTGEGGLTKDYAFSWSYGVAESMTLIVPNFYGGGSGGDFRGTQLHTTVMNNLKSQGVNKADASEQANRQVGALFYFGDQPFVGAPAYYGAIVCFLFVLGLILVKGPIKWWLAVSAVFVLMIAWGKNFSSFNYLLFDNFPLFNKFRAVSMMLGIGQLVMVLLGILGVKAFFDTKTPKGEALNALKIAQGVTLGLCAVAILASFTMDFSGGAVTTLSPEQQAFLTPMLLEDRPYLIRWDAMRSIIYIALAGGMMYLYLIEKLKPVYGMMLVGLLGTVDMWGVSKRYLDYSDFQTKQERTVVASPASEQINSVDPLSTTSPVNQYRVLDMNNPFNNARTSYFHNSLGGYHAAKLMIYQEMAEKYLLAGQPSEAVMSMLNTRYVLTQQGQPVSLKDKALGNAWFVNGFDLVENADAELAALANFNPSEKAIIQKRFAKYLEGFTPTKDAAGSIQLTDYHPDHLTYSSTASSEQLAVFSEIYYNPEKGWKVFLDGKEVAPFVKANYALRALRVPAGQHTIEMKFAPTPYTTGRTINAVASLSILGMFFASLFFWWRKEGEEVLANTEPLFPPATTKQEKTAEALNPTKSRKRPARRKKK